MIQHFYKKDLLLIRPNAQDFLLWGHYQICQRGKSFYINSGGFSVRYIPGEKLWRDRATDDVVRVLTMGEDGEGVEIL